MPLDDDVKLEEISKDCHGYVGADIAQLASSAAQECFRE